MDGAFLDSDNSPSVPSEGLGDAAIPAPVRFDFLTPEGSIRSGQVLAGATVPETAIHKKRYFLCLSQAKSCFPVTGLCRR